MERCEPRHDLGKEIRRELLAHCHEKTDMHFTDKISFLGDERCTPLLCFPLVVTKKEFQH